MFGIAKKLQYAYLPDNLATKYNIDPAKLARVKKVHRKVKKLFTGLQGREKNLRKAIIKGAKQKSSDFSLKGMDGLLADLQGLESIGQLAELGNLGAAATAASVGAATGVLAKIGSWLKPIKNLFSKIRGKAAVKKIARLTRKGKEVSHKLHQRVAQFQQQQAILEQTVQPQSQPASTPVVNTLPQQTRSYSQPQVKTGNYTPQSSTTAPVVSQAQPVLSTKKKLGKGVKIGIGLGVAALIGTGAYFMFRDNEEDDKNESEAKARTKKSSEKKSLGSIELQ